MPESTVVLDHDDMRRTLMRIAHEIVEKNPAGAVAIVGIHRRGAVLATRLHALVGELLDAPVPLGDVDISFYRDDLSIRPSAPVVHSTHLDFPIDGRTIVIVDDVLYTGRTVRAAVEQIFDYGRPARIQLAVLVDRGHRELPIRPDYVGKNLPTSQTQRVNVRVQEVDGRDEVTIGPAAERGALATTSSSLASSPDGELGGTGKTSMSFLATSPDGELGGTGKTSMSFLATSPDGELGGAA